MKKKIIFKIVLVLAILQLIVEILFLDFDNLVASFSWSKIISTAIPILIIIQMVISLKSIAKED